MHIGFSQEYIVYLFAGIYFFLSQLFFKYKTHFMLSALGIWSYTIAYTLQLYYMLWEVVALVICCTFVAVWSIDEPSLWCHKLPYTKCTDSKCGQSTTVHLSDKVWGGFYQTTIYNCSPWDPKNTGG